MATAPPETVPFDVDGSAVAVSSDIISSEDADSEDKSRSLVKKLPPDILLIVFIHGSVPFPCSSQHSVYSRRYIRFKGNDATFGPFPDRLRHVLAETIDNVIVETIVFPAYEVSAQRNQSQPHN